MADFVDSEAEESNDEGSEDEMDVSPVARRKEKKKHVLESEDDDEEDDGEEVKDLIDDNPIEEDSDNESERSRKRKKSDDEDDEDFDDRLEDEDYELLEENLGVKVQRKKFKRLRRIQEEDSDEEGTQDPGEDREAIANQLFEGSENEEERVPAREESTTQYASEESEGEYSETDDFIVDDEGRPLTEKRKKRKPIFTDSSLQEAQDIFGVDFDYDDFEKYEDEYYEEEEEEEDDYEDEDEETRTARLAKKTVRKGRKPRSIYEIYEPSELERAGFTDEDNLLRSQDIPERMQLRTVPLLPALEEELDEEAEWIYELSFRNEEGKGGGVEKTARTGGDPNTALPTATGGLGGGEDWDDDPAPVVTPIIPPISAMDENWDDEPSSVALPVNTPQTDGGAPAPAAAQELKPKLIPKIRKALEFMRNQHLEVPFIAFYRKEYVEPELGINDLWTIYRMDARYSQLRSRKTRLSLLFRNMQAYQTSLILSRPDEPLPDSTRLIRDLDLERVKSVRTQEELKDMYLMFSLYYTQDLSPMKDYLASQRKSERRKAVEAEGGEAAEQEELEEERLKETTLPEIKRKTAGGPYALCRKFGLDTMAKQFGLTPEQFSENLRDNYQRHEVEQYPTDPLTACHDFISPRLATAEDVLRAAKFMVGMQISREPLVRKCVREVFFERATVDVTPTRKGLKEIDESHAVFPLKYIRGKPVRDLGGDMFLKLCIAEEDGLVLLAIGHTIRGITAANYLDEVKQLYYKDEFSKNVQEWNKLRGECVDFALELQLYPALRKELRAKLLEEAKQFVLKACSLKLHHWIKVKPFLTTFPDEDDEEWDTSKGSKVLAIAYVPDLDQAAFACFLSPDGDASDYLRLQNITKNRNSFRETDRLEKEADLIALKNFIRQKKPHLVVVSGESRDAQMIQEDLRAVLAELVTEDRFPSINVEICDNEEAKVYASSLKAQTDFREYPLLLRQAISLGRRMQDPLVEFSQLCTPDDEILCLRFHPLQDHVAKEELLEYLQLEFVNRTNEVGVDVNRAIAYPFTFNLVQFICGLGPRKAAALVKTLKQNNQRLENRTQLITVCHMGPKIFINCSGFIKIDTNSLGDSTEAYVEVLDGSRVHPETYEWARKMAVDALEYDDEDANPAGALEEILEAPERLKDLDLDAFAEELERQGFGNKGITLYDIRSELHDRYKDQRTPYQPPNAEELFNMLTRETPDTLYIGKLITANVVGISHKKPIGEQLDNAIPVRNEETGMWQCSFCLKNDFPDLSEVWNHFDANACPGQATGIRLRLDNGISGFIPIAKLSDKQVTNPENRVKRGQTIHCRVSKIDVERFSVECTSRTSDLADLKDEWKQPKDPFYDLEAEAKTLKRDQESKKLKQRQTYVKRVIVHQSFRNISYKEAEKLMETMEQGEVVVRPSSKGADHLTVTWKVLDGVYQHIDVKEEKKENAFSLGQSLWIGTEEFEDLDEILARHINPMAAYARDVLNFKYFKGLEGRGEADEYLMKEKEKSGNKIHYVLLPAKEYPGKFILAYLPKTKVHHEFITIRPEGFRFRQQNFDSLLLLFKWFKEHYRDPLPSGTPLATPLIQHHRTPYATPGYNDVTKVGMSGGQLGHGLANTTPHYATPAQAYTPFSTFTSHTPYTPTAQTPFMTPYQTPLTTGTTPKLSNPQPSQAGGFTQPMPTPATRGAQHRVGARNNTSGSGNDPLDWRRAAEAWAKSQQKGHPQTNQRAEVSSTGAPATRNAAQVIFEGIEKTRQMSSAHNFLSHKSPKSGRESLKSTPRTNFSPRSMVESSLGDETPLFDEN